MKWHEPITDPYLRERICSCPDGFQYQPDFNWDKCFQEMIHPPTCKRCNLWSDRVHTCLHCRQQYYQFFWHPLMGREASIDKFPWECWDCLETWHRYVPCPGTIKTPPPEMVLVPARTIPVVERSPAMQSLFDKLAAL